jgi:hypothetical protein
MRKTFKKFIEEKQQSSYISSLEDELGINVNDLEKEPQIAKFFSFGKGNISNISPYKIIEFKRNEDGKITHAVVCKNSDPAIHNRQYKNKDGNIVRVNNDLENKKIVIAIEDLDKLLSQDFSATQTSL